MLHGQNLSPDSYVGKMKRIYFISTFCDFDVLEGNRYKSLFAFIRLPDLRFMCYVLLAKKKLHKTICKNEGIHIYVNEYPM